MFFGTMSVFISIFFFITFAVIAFTIGKGFSEWSSNNRQDVVTYKATVTAKRRHHSATHHAPMNDMPGQITSSTDYFVTFQDEYGSRQEFRVKDRDYGLISEGDMGLVSHQGTRFKGFERDRQSKNGDMY